MLATPRSAQHGLPPEFVLPATFVARYLTFLARRPISQSNAHFVGTRLRALSSVTSQLVDAEGVLSDVLREGLSSLVPATLTQRAPALSDALLRLLPARLPDHVVSSAAPPGAGYFAELENVTVLFGPAIGIGDEIACAALLDRIRRDLPAARLRVLTCYPGLWQALADLNGVSPAHEVELYRDDARILEVMRGAARTALTLLVDFEQPALWPAALRDPNVARYVELSLSAQELRVWCPRTARVHHYRHDPRFLGNLYEGLNAMLCWCFANVGRPEHVARVAPVSTRAQVSPADAPLRVLVTPFTAKYDPSLAFWCEFLVPLCRSPRPLQIRVDGGRDPATRSFASALVKAVAPQCTRGASIEGLPAGELPALLHEISGSDVLLSVDTFAPHAAARLSRSSVVVARRGLEFWRIPDAFAFYGYDDLPAQELAALVHLVIEAADPHAAAARVRHMHALAQPLLRAAHALESAPTRAAEEGLHAWRAYHERWRALVDDALHWSGQASVLLCDADYAQLRGDPTQSALAPCWDDALQAHVRAALRQRGNTNLGKYLALCAHGAARS